MAVSTKIRIDSKFKQVQKILVFVNDVKDHGHKISNYKSFLTLKGQNIVWCSKKHDFEGKKCCAIIRF